MGSLATLPPSIVAANGFDAFSHAVESITALTDRAFAQKRRLDDAPCPLGRDRLAGLFRSAMRHW